MATWEITEAGDPAFRALGRAIDVAKAGDPLQPVTVAVSAPYAGLALRRRLAAAPDQPGIVNVRFMPLDRIAELLGAPALATNRDGPLTPLLEQAALRAALLHDPRSFAPVARHPGTEQRLALAFRDLRRAPHAARRRLASTNQRNADLVALFDDITDRTRAYYTVDDLVTSAVHALHTGSAALADLGAIVVHAPGDLTPAELAFVDALLARTGGHAVCVLTGDELADRSTAALVEHLHASLGPVAEPVIEPLVGTSIIDAPEPDDEIRAVVRGLIDRAQRGIPWNRLAVAYRDAEPFARLVHEHLDASGIPWSGTTSRTLADTVTGRAVLGLLTLAGGEFRREDLGVWLAGAPIREPERRHEVPAARWEALARQAGVVGGLDQWVARLGRLRHELTTDLARVAASDGASEGWRGRLQHDIEHVERMQSFVSELAAALQAPSSPTWSRMANWLTRLLVTYLGPDDARAEWPDVEVDAHVAINDRLGALSELDALELPTDAATFRQVVESQLSVPLPSRGRFGRGVFVGRLLDLADTDFDTVFVVGMIEGRFPGRVADDPLLPDRSRGGSTGIPSRVDHRALERRQYLRALAAAPERVLTFSRVDTRGRREQRPSPWILETASHLAGDRRTASRIGSADDDWLLLVDSFESALMATATPGSLQEFDLRALSAWARAHGRIEEHPLVANDTSLAGAVRAGHERHATRLSSFSGLVGPVPDLTPDLDRPISASALETYAKCPFRYFLQYVLRIEALETPDDLDVIAPLARGVLLHDILREFISTSPRLEPTQSWSPDDRSRLRAIAQRRFDEEAETGYAGKPLAWSFERHRLQQELYQTLDTDNDIRATFGVVPEAVEVGFGMPDGDVPAVRFALAGHTPVAFKGRIDRVDRSPDGDHLAVWDYKTGSKHPYKKTVENPLGQGTRLQLAVYGLAARERWGDTPPVDVGYWFTTEEGVDKLIHYRLTDEIVEEFAEVLDTVVGGITAGRFPARPGADENGVFENCRSCSFDRICPADRDRVWSRVSEDPMLAPYVALAEPREKAP